MKPFWKDMAALFSLICLSGIALAIADAAFTSSLRGGHTPEYANQVSNFVILLVATNPTQKAIDLIISMFSKRGRDEQK